MANANRGSGFSPVRYMSGLPWTGAVNIYSIAASYGTELCIGDPVISSGTADTNGVAGVVLGAATGALRGVIVGLGKGETGVFNPDNLNITYRPASDAAVWYAMVVDDPNVLFEIQEESNGTALAATHVGLNTVPLLAARDGLLSGWLLRSATGATPGTTNTLQLRLMGLNRKPGNAFGAYAKWLVKINVHELSSVGVAGV